MEHSYIDLVVVSHVDSLNCPCGPCSQILAAGASLKFTLLNRQGRVWTLIAGGGASVAPGSNEMFSYIYI